MANTIIFNLKSSTCLSLGTFRRCQVSKSVHLTRHHGFYSKTKFNRFSVPDQKLALIFQNDFGRKMNMVVFANIPEGAPLPVDPSPGNYWKGWIIGTIVTILLSFTRGKWGPLLLIKEKIQTTIEEAEHVADIVEEVAERVEKVADEAAKNLPEGKLQDFAETVGNVAEDIDKHAESVEDALEKVEEIDKQLESFIKSNNDRQDITDAATTTSKDQK